MSEDLEVVRPEMDGVAMAKDLRREAFVNDFIVTHAATFRAALISKGETPEEVPLPDYVARRWAITEARKLAEEIWESTEGKV